MGTYQGATLGICSTTQASTLNQSAFAALTYVNIGSIGKLGTWGTTDNIVTYDTMNTTVSSKSKGVADGGSPQIECERIKTDAGQVILRTAGASAAYYAFKLTLADGTVRYNRGVVSGPLYEGADGPDSIDTETYTLAFVQKTIEV